jgi:hypothetical protein
MVRAAVEADLSVTAKRVVRIAEGSGWAVVGVVTTTGQGETFLSLRGRRGDGRFVVTFLDGSVEGVYWWTRQHSTVVAGYREVEHVTVDKAWSVNIGKKLKRDTELDEVVQWETERHERVKLGSLAELVGVAGGKNPRRGLLEIA